MSTDLRGYEWTLTDLGVATAANKKAVAARVDTKAGAVRITKKWSGAVELCVFVPGECGCLGARVG